MSIKLPNHFVVQDFRYINNKYSLVPLNLMLEYAIKQDVPFYKDHKEANPPVKYPFEHEIPDTKEFDGLLEYLQIMRTIVFDGKGTNYEIPSNLYNK